MSKTFKMGPAGDLQLGIEAYNIFNSRVATSISSTQLNQEGEIEATGRQDPFTLEFQLRYHFL